MRVIVVVIAAVTVACCGTARADLVYNMTSKLPSADPPMLLKHRLSLATDRLAVQSNAGGAPTRFVFRDDKKLLWMIDVQNHAYMEVDEPSVKALAAQVGPIMEKMQENMAKLPAHQRATMEDILKMQAKSAAEPTPKVETRKTKTKETIAGYPCTRWDVLHDGVKVSEIWATDWKRAKVDKSEFAVLARLSAFLDILHAASPATRNLSHESDLVNELDRVDGFPVRIRQFKDGMLAAESTLDSVDSEKIDPAAFEVPAGFTKQLFGPTDTR